MDQNHSAALGAKILTKEALVQAELLKVQLHGMLLKLDPLRPEKRLSRKNQTVNSKKLKTEGNPLLRAMLVSAGISVLISLFFLRIR